MQSGSDSAPRGGRNNLEQVIDGLEQRLDDLASAQRQTRLLVLAGSALLLGLMGLFGLRLYSTLQRQLASSGGRFCGAAALPSIIWTRSRRSREVPALTAGAATAATVVPRHSPLCTATTSMTSAA